MTTIDTANEQDSRSNSPTRPWIAPFWGCLDDPLICLRAFCLPAGLFGSNAAKTDGSSCPGMCAVYCLLMHFNLCCLPHMQKRGILRKKYGLQEDPCDDMLATAFCSPCALSQEAREIKARANPSNALPVRSQPIAVYRR